jgi:hypothetical protein
MRIRRFGLSDAFLPVPRELRGGLEEYVAVKVADVVGQRQGAAELSVIGHANPETDNPYDAGRSERPVYCRVSSVLDFNRRWQVSCSTTKI